MGCIVDPTFLLVQRGESITKTPRAQSVFDTKNGTGCSGRTVYRRRPRRRVGVGGGVEDGEG